MASVDLQLLAVVPFDETFLSASAGWLQDNELAALIMTGPFDARAQAEWYASLPRRLDYKIWGVKFKGQPIGAFGLKNISANRAEYFGYIGEKSFWGRGIGKWILDEAVAKARALSIECLTLRVAHQNGRARSLYLRFGFQQKGLAGDAVIMELRI